MQSLPIFPLFYLPPIEYFSALKTYDFTILIEKHEHFPKQTYRNRAKIYSPNGVLDLIVPVIKGSKVHTKMKDVKISYDFTWQRTHWLSLQTCYRNSAYFEYYEDEIAGFYFKHYTHLFDYNLEWLNWVFSKLKIGEEVKFTEEYVDDQPGELDMRGKIHFKNNSQYNNKPYFQVFEDRHGFLPNLSIVDLLFNQGPQAKQYI